MTDKLEFGKNEELLFKYHFDQIHNLHGYKLFNQKQPLKINVKWILEPINGEFKANLKHVKDSLTEAYDYDVHFNLFIVGINGNNYLNWKFDFDEVPDDDIIILNKKFAEIILFDELLSHIRKNILEKCGLNG
ncbi:MAG TPA: hypothetical protein VK444_02855 [Methanobacteriaceae archaeon]|nr:hypothetical protein [Methanobacteriaceae archaeon]